jgi:hypothetical protein
LCRILALVIYLLYTPLSEVARVSKQVENIGLAYLLAVYAGPMLVENIVVLLICLLF